MRLLLSMGLAILLLAACTERPDGPRALSPAARNRLRGQAYVRDLEAQGGHVRLADGVLLRTLAAGQGPTLRPDAPVLLRYTGRTINGVVFNAPEEPVRFDPRSIIPGLRSALMQMQVGGSYEAVIPERLAYGLDGSPPAIGPNETLIFTVEVISIAGPTP